MSQINPLAFAFAQTPQAQRLQTAERDAEVKKARLTEKNAGIDEDGDTFVESVDAIDAVDDDTRRDSTPRRQHKPAHHDSFSDDSGDDPSRLDIQA